MLHRRHLLRFAAAGAMLAALPGAATAQTLTPVTVAIPNPALMYLFPLAVGLDRGLFEAEGLKVDFQVVDGSAQVIQMMAAGQAQIGNPGPAPLLSAVARGVDIVFIYNFSTYNGWRMGVPVDSSIQAIADLKGKVIGVGTSDGSDAGFARSVLGSAGLGASDYQLMPVGDGGPALAAFNRNDIEAYVAGTSEAATMKLRGLELRDLTPAQFSGFFSNGLAVMRPFMTENRDTVVAFGRAWVKGLEFAMDEANENAVLEAIYKFSPSEGEDKDFSRAFFRELRTYRKRLDETKGWGYQDPAAWQRWHDTLVASGDLASPLPDLTKAYSNEFVETWNAK